MISKSRIYNGVARAHRYRANIPNPEFDSMYPDDVTKQQFIPNTETRDAFVVRMVQDFLLRSVRKAEVDAAGREAAKTAEREITLT